MGLADGEAELSELHVRKVREVETGGQPTPLEEPYKLVMNLSHTGFTGWMSKRPMFESVTIEKPKQMPINLAFNT